MRIPRTLAILATAGETRPFAAKLFSDSVGKFSPLVWVLDCEAAWGVADRKARVIAEVFESELRNLRGKDIRVALYVANQK